MHRNRSIISISLNLLLVFTLLAPSAIMARPLPSALPVLVKSEPPDAEESRLSSPTAMVESPVDRPLDTDLEAPPTLPGDSLASAADPLPDPRIEAQVMQAARAGLSSLFIENVGQFDSEARFQLRGGTAGTVYLADDGIWLTLLEPIPEPIRRCLGREREPQCAHSGVNDAPPSRRGVNVKFNFVGANPTPRIVGINPLDMNISYIFGNDADKWRQNVPVYGGVRYEDLYPGIDIEYVVSDGAWQTRLIAQPGADLSAVDLKIEGATSRGTNADDLLQLETAVGPALIFPLLPGVEDVEANSGSGIFSKPLLLEHRIQSPTSNGEGLIYSTFLGGADSDNGLDIAIDSSGNAFIVGVTWSSDFPTTTGAFDTSGNSDANIFVVKLNSDGSALEYATFLGGSDIEEGTGIAVNSEGNAYITGHTNSSDFPTTTGAFDTTYAGGSGFFYEGDAFIVKMNATGTDLEYASYIGGAGRDVSNAITVNAAGNAYVTGGTYSHNFPTTVGAFDTTYNWTTNGDPGAADAFVVKMNTVGSDLEYATFLGGTTFDEGTALALNTGGEAFITGRTLSSDFPTTSGAFETIHQGYYDAFVVKINESGSALQYATFLGGDREEFGYGIVVDGIGHAYVTGHTDSTDFPTTPGAFDTSHNGTWDYGGDIYVAKLKVDGSSLDYATFLGGSKDETYPRIAIDAYGSTYITGQTHSPDFPVTPGAWDTAYDEFEIIIVKLNRSGSAIDYATFLSGSGGDSANGIVVDASGSVYVVGVAASDDFPTTMGAFSSEFNGGTDAFVVKMGPLSTLYPGQDWSAYPECPLCSAGEAVGSVGGPINTRNGNLNYQESDLSIPVQGGALEFRRSYVSQAVDVYTSTLGHGWTHNYDTRLHFTNNALTDTVELQAPGGSRLPFFENDDGTYSPYAGVTAQLSRITATNPITTQYVVTAFNQMAYTFDHRGLLLQQEDAGGNVITFTHNAQGQLTQAAQGARSLSYDYDPTTGYLSGVTDNAGRSVELGYEGGDLTVVTGTLGLASTYHYSGTTHLLTEVVDPSGVTIEETAYDDQDRAYRQWNGMGNLLVDINFAISNTHVITEHGVVMTHTYDARGALVDTAFACASGAAGCGSGTEKAYDYNFKASQVVDANGNATSLAWDAGGSNLEQVTNALGNSTALEYDALNNLVQVVNGRGLTTTYGYDNPSLPTFRTVMTDALGSTTVYTPTVDGLLAAEQDANGSVTTYDYNSFGQVTQVVQAVGTSEAMTTTYGYDEVGRLQTTTAASATESHTALNVYDDGDRLVATIANWTGGNPALWQNDCDTSQGARDSNVCTRYAYDAAGRTISTTNSLEQTNLTFYDSAGRVAATVSNWNGSAYTTYHDLCNFSSPNPEDNVCNLTGYDAAGRVISTTNALGHVTRTFYDSRGRVAGTVQNSVSISSLAQCAYPPTSSDQDLCTAYEYDAAGNTIIITDTVGRQTRTFYDQLNRVAGTVENWSGTITQTAGLANCLALPVARDHDLCTLYAYDEIGNTTIVTDTVGRMTRTFYDALNRVAGMVQNWQAGFALEDCFDPGLDPQRDENVCTLYGYDEAGNRVVVTDAKNNKRHTVYDSANRPVVQVQNWDGTTAITAGGSGCADTTTNPHADENLCSFTEYDALGRRASVTDVLGNVTEFDYDGLGRVVTTTRYLDGAPVQRVTGYDALGNRLSQTDTNGHTTTFTYDGLNRLALTTSHEGVTTTQTYNAAGWVLSTTNGLNHTTTNIYDNLGRLLTTTDPKNNTTQYEYDAAGNQVAMIDAEGVKTSYAYDDLHRHISVTENDTGGAQTDDSNLLTEYVYDALGNRTLITNARGYSVTLTVYDELNRPVLMQDALGNTTQVAYDLLGNRTVMTDANGEVTNYSYDALNRLITTTYTADGVTVSTQYDAAGNRTQMVDDVGTTTYQYDDFYRLITVTNPFNAVVGYRYDAAGNRTQLIYPDGREVGYTYDGDNRLLEVEDWNSDLTTYQYDGAGRLITTTLPNGVVSLNGYDDANRLLSLRHEGADSSLLAEYLYQLDGVGNRVAVTETVRAPDMVETIDAYIEQNGLLVLEAENGTATASGSHDWETQAAQTGYEGSGYRRALPDMGARYEETETVSSSHLSWPIYNETADTYSVWVRGMAPDAAGDSLHVGLDGSAPSSAADLTGFTNEWDWSHVTMSGGDATLDLTNMGSHTLEAWMREDGLHVDRLLLVTDTNYIPTGLGPAESLFQTITETIPGGLGTTSIVYQYDALYRLTDATYSGTITATFAYEYDPVGNMTTYTETVDAQTTSVSRTFDAANRLQTALDLEAGATSYYYDDNGNLVEILPPGATGQDPIGSLRYGYDQRKLLITHTTYVSGTGWVLQAEYVYDGANDRLQQVDYTGATPVTTTYTNDVFRLTQVLVADDGTTQVYNLFGLDLISQDSDSEVRTLLVDGLGSVRLEMVGGVVETATTYSPYGEVLSQSSTSGTVYGFTGEQEDGATGLLYLRARYYSPHLKVFQSRDPWEGTGWRPGTLNYYNFVHNNPIRYTDPLGQCAREPHDPYFDYECWQKARQLNTLYSLPIEFLSVLELMQLQFFEAALAQLEIRLPMFSRAAIQTLSEATAARAFLERLKEPGGWDVIGVRIDGSFSGFHGLNASLDFLFNFAALESSALFNLNYTLGIQAGFAGAGGLFIGCNAPTNEAFTGWGSGLTISGSAAGVGGAVQWDVSDRIFWLGNMMPERHAVRADDPMNFTVMYSTGFEVEFSVTVFGYTWELYTFRFLR